MNRKSNTRRSRRTAGVIVVLALITIGATGLAAASQLSVVSSDVIDFSEAPCSHTPLSVRVQPQGFGANRSAVRITNVPEECFGNTFEVGVSNSAGTLLASGSATCTTAGCTIPTGNYNAPSVVDAHALVATWGIPANWTSTCTFIIFFWYCS